MLRLTTARAEQLTWMNRRGEKTVVMVVSLQLHGAAETDELRKKMQIVVRTTPRKARDMMTDD
jgi:hypothetical protein